MLSTGASLLNYRHRNAHVGRVLGAVFSFVAGLGSAIVAGVMGAAWPVWPRERQPEPGTGLLLSRAPAPYSVETRDQSGG